MSAAYVLVAAGVAVCSSVSCFSSILASKNGQSTTGGAGSPGVAPPPTNPASSSTSDQSQGTQPPVEKKLTVQSKTAGGELAGKAPSTFAPKSGTPAPTSAPAPSGGGASTSGGGGFTFSVPKALALLNQRRTKEGLPPFSIDTALMNGAQRRANAGEFPHTLDWYLAAGACENLSVECKGSGDQAVEWGIYKLWDYERDNKQNATAPGSPCYAVIPTDQGHYRNFTNKVATCSSNKLGIGVAPLKKFNGGAPPSHMTTLVVFWIK